MLSSLWSRFALFNHDRLIWVSCCLFQLFSHFISTWPCESRYPLQNSNWHCSSGQVIVAVGHFLQRSVIVSRGVWLKEWHRLVEVHFLNNGTVLHLIQYFCSSLIGESFQPRSSSEITQKVIQDWEIHLVVWRRLCIFLLLSISKDMCRFSEKSPNTSVFGPEPL